MDAAIWPSVTVITLSVGIELLVCNVACEIWVHVTIPCTRCETCEM